MDYQTLKKLSQNPHYKLSPKQRVALDGYERPKMVQFGEPEINDNTFSQHEVKLKKIKTKRYA